MEKKNSIESLNEQLPEFFLSDLEERLETDPMNVGALVTLQTNMTAANAYCTIHGTCEKGYCQPRSWCVFDS